LSVRRAAMGGARIPARADQIGEGIPGLMVRHVDNQAAIHVGNNSPMIAHGDGATAAATDAAATADFLERNLEKRYNR